jgi:hypothetical protein
MELLSNYIITIQYADPNGEFVTLSIGKKSDEFKISDGDKNVLGYAKAVVDDARECRLENAEMTIAKDSKGQVGNSNNWIKYTDDQEIDIVATKKKSAASGSTLKGTKSPWKDILDTDVEVKVSVAGGTCEALSLDVIDDTAVTASDKANFNLVAFGGDMANGLTADAVTSGLSTVDWASSAGEIEVIDSAFSSGKYLVIAAGENRDATQLAADTMAAMV